MIRSKEPFDREKFDLPQEEIDFLKEHEKRYWEN